MGLPYKQQQKTANELNRESIPTGRKQASWLCTSTAEELNQRLNLEQIQPRSQGFSSLPPLVVGTETLVAAGHVTIYPSKTPGWVGTQVHLDG